MPSFKETPCLFPMGSPIDLAFFHSPFFLFIFFQKPYNFECHFIKFIWNSKLNLIYPMQFDILFSDGSVIIEIYSRQVPNSVLSAEQLGHALWQGGRRTGKGWISSWFSGAPFAKWKILGKQRFCFYRWPVCSVLFVCVCGGVLFEHIH